MIRYLEKQMKVWEDELLEILALLCAEVTTSSLQLSGTTFTALVGSQDVTARKKILERIFTKLSL